VVVGENTLLVAQVGIAGSTEIGSGCILAGQSGVVDHVELGNGVVVGAQAGVLKSFPPHTRISGYPARPHAESKRAYAALFQLPGLLTRINRLESELARLTKRHG
jgi:UDP-3-O-[3-hydroxymyristoyl] glucosamine N-acyltransferase